MKTRLEKKEIFIPLAGGADTSGDPRAPKSPTVTAENVDFNIDNIARPRDALATFVGNVAADTPTAVSDLYMFYNNSIVIAGSNCREVAANGSTSPSSINSVTKIIDVYETHLISKENTDVTFAESYGARINSSALSESAIVLVFDQDMSVIGENTGSILTNTTITLSEDKFLVSNSDVKVYNIVWGSSNCFVYSIGSSDSSISSVNAAFSLDGTKNSGIFYGNVSSTDRALMSAGNGANCVISNIRLTNAQQVAYANVAGSANGTVTLSYNFFIDATNVVTAFLSSNATDAYLSLSVDSLSDAAVTHVSSDTNSMGFGSSAVKYYVSGWANSATSGYILTGIAAASGQPYCDMFEFSFSSGTVSIGQQLTGTQGGFPISEPIKNGGDVYCAFYNVAAPLYLAAPTNADLASEQQFITVCKFVEDGASNVRWVPVARFADHKTTRAYLHSITKNNVSRSFHDKAGNDSIILSISDSINPANSNSSYGAGTRSVWMYGINFSNQKIRPVSFGEYQFIPSALPYLYDGTYLTPPCMFMHPEGPVVNVNTSGTDGAWGNAGGPGTYYWSATFRTIDSLGNEMESAPSPASIGTVASNTDEVAVTITVQSPVSLPYAYQKNKAYVDLYRTSANGNDFFRVATSQIGTGSIVITDYGSVSFSANTGIDRLLLAKPLYTMNGELENDNPLSHRCGTAHSGRYFYAPRRHESSRIMYSKSKKPGIAPEFNEVLSFDVNPCGGSIRSLESNNEKLFIGKERAWMVTYGEPLNDAGVGQGFAPPRIITQEAGVKYPTAAAAGTPGIFFINSVDGLIYLIDGGENVQYVGAPVRHYCETYAYDNVWYAPQDGCVRFSSATVGAPTLSFNYRYNRWSTFTGRYDDGIRAAFAAPVGPSNSYVDVVMDVNGNVYVQDPTGTNATVESFNVNISTSWISLGDMLGYGKFYKWTLIGSKKSSSLNLNLKTAYDYEPYWTDSQDYNASALTSFSTVNQFGTMASNTFVDQALKIQVDGSRHKTDAVRLCVSTNNGTTRDSVELLGAKLEIGVRPGSTRLGSGRTVS